ncbi:MAG: hypothetical protein JSR17_03900 [Proteobacteria bacterium]|nr:hypothetical protein [Pseudomonadota bacterium]
MLTGGGLWEIVGRYLRGEAIADEERTEKSDNSLYFKQGSGSEHSGSSLYHQYRELRSGIELQSHAQQLSQRYRSLVESAPQEYREDIQRSGERMLAPFLSPHSNTWLNSTEIDRWFDSLSEQYPYVSNIHSWYKEGYLSEIGPQGARPADRERLLSAQTIYWPCALNNHWYLLTISKTEECINITCADSFNYHEQHPYFFSLGMKLINALYGSDCPLIAYNSEHIPRQNNGFDCGPAICATAKRKCENRDLRAPINYTHFRLEMAQTIIDRFQDPREFSLGIHSLLKRRTPSLKSTAQSSTVIDLERPETQRLRRRGIKV